MMYANRCKFCMKAIPAHFMHSSRDRVYCDAVCKQSYWKAYAMRKRIEARRSEPCLICETQTKNLYAYCSKTCSEKARRIYQSIRCMNRIKKAREEREKLNGSHQQSGEQDTNAG